MRILFAPNSFKGSISARDICARASFLSVAHDVKFMPFSDGGDGVLDVFAASFPSAKIYKVKAKDALGRTKEAPYLFLPDGNTCVIESAKVCGLGELKKSELDIIHASSYGIGQVIKAAYKKGARTFYIGLGGVAFNDGGTGMAKALGYKFFDASGREIGSDIKTLRSLAVIKRSSFGRDIKVYGLSDVDNPLLGEKGSARVYGPQKGANAAQVAELEESMAALCRAAKKGLGVNINTRHCGAAGALGAGLKGFLGAKLVSGAPFIAARLNLTSAVKQADLIITGEGKLDGQTFYGKGPFYICDTARRLGKPVIFICGLNEIKDKALLSKYSIVKVVETSRMAGSVDKSYKKAGFYIQAALKDLFG